nr:HYR domain-containing protein [Saprospiraceae bacterium]
SMIQTRKLFLLLLCLAVGQVLVAQTTYSTIQTGFWNAASTWDANGIPPNPIPADATVEINHLIQEHPVTGLPKTNNGTININADALLTIYLNFDNYGTINAKGGPTYSEFRIVIATFNNKAGGVLKTSGGPAASITVWSDGLINNEAGGLIEVAPGGELRMTWQGNNRLNNAGTIDNRGYILSRGAFVNTVGSKLYNDNGRVQMIDAPMTIGGEVKLTGDSEISVQGNLTVLSGSSIEWVLTAPPSGFNYPYIYQYLGIGTYGTVDLKVSLAPGFEPDGGAIYNIFHNTNPVPADAVSLPALTGGKTWKESRAPDYSGIRLEVEEEVSTEPGAALASNGNSQLVTVPDDASLDIECELSIEFWCKPTAYETWGAMVMKASGNSWSNGYGIYLRGQVLYFFPTGFGTQHNTGYAVPLNKWTHIAATYDGTESKVYINGILESTKTIGLPIPTNNYPMGISGDPGYPSFNFNGHLDEVRVWNKALTRTEIQANKDCEIQTTSDCLVANYHFNQGVAGADNAGVTTLTDDSGNGNDGTLGSGYALTGTTSNWVAPGGVTSGQACSGSIVCEPIVSAPPTCPGNVVVGNAAGLCGAYVTFDVASGDVASPPSGSYFPVGTTTVVITGSSDCGEAQTCSFTVTVNDTEKPTVSNCPSSDLTFNNTQSLCGSILLLAINALDNCPGATIEQTEGLASGSLFPVGETQMTYVATDASDNTAECSFTITVNDNEKPVAVCKDVTVNFNGEASIDLTPSQVWNEAASDDNCGTIYYVSTSPSLSISCDDLGSVVPLTVTIRDEAGNTDNCTADVTVTGLPCGWSEGADDGSLNCPGSTEVDYDLDDESFAVSADGCWHDCREPDQAAYVYQELCGDGTLTARLASINTKGYAGLMLRESLDPEARRAGALKNTSTRRVRREYRSAYGGIVTQAHSNRSRVEWFRIVRKGNEVKTYTSTNGSYWRLLYRVIFPSLEDCVYVGMMAYSTNGSSEVEAVFDNVSFSGSGSSLIDNNTSLPNTFTAFDSDLELEQPDVNIFPNPSNGQSQIELNGFQETPAQIWVRDAFGKVVRQIELDNPEGAILPLELQDMPAGLYLISVMQDQQQVITKKLMIQK